MTVDESGVIRAGVFVRFQPSKSEVGLLAYAEARDGGGPEESRRTIFRVKSPSGWKRKR
jgi:hypothetical protein